MGMCSTALSGQEIQGIEKSGASLTLDHAQGILKKWWVQVSPPLGWNDLVES